MRTPLRQRKRHKSQQTIGYLILLVLLIIFMVTVGFRLIIHTSIWLSNQSRGDAPQQSSDAGDEFLLAPELFNVPDATNSARIDVAGRGTAGGVVTIFVNDEKVDTIELKKDEFDATIPLDDGVNALYVQLEDVKRKRTKDSETYSIVVLREKPSLEVTSPQDGETVAKQGMTVEGSTDENVTVRINNSPTVVSSDGSFRRTIQLKEGDNTIEVTATDIAGNTETVSIRVRYERE